MTPPAAPHPSDARLFPPLPATPYPPMAIRPKTVRRLIVLLVALALLIGGGVFAYRKNEAYKAAEVERYGREGLAAYAKKDYQTALDNLKRYVGPHPGDRDALFAYGVSRERVEASDGRNLTESRTVFNTLLQRNPDDLEAQHELIGVYLKTGQSGELIQLADRVLAAHPDDPVALRGETFALVRTEKVDAALATALRYNKAAPEDIEGHLLTLALSRRLNRPADAIVDRYQALLDRHPGDPRYELLMALADGYANDVKAALDLLRKAAAHRPTDPDVIRQIARNLDRLQRFGESQAFLETVADRDHADAPVVLTLVRRLWQDGRYQDVLDRLAKQPDAEKADANLKAFRALALYGLGRTAEANRVADALGADADPLAKAWGRALAAEFDPSLAAPARIDALQRSKSADRGNGLYYKWIGDAYYGQGETELALRNWRAAADAEASWATPLVQASQALLAEGRVAEADRLARDAEQRARSLPVVVNGLLVGHARLQRDPKNKALAAALLDRVGQVQKAIPNEPNTLPMYVDLLARAGRDADAKAAIDAALAAGVSPDVRLQLAGYSRAYQLGLAPELVATPAGEITPALALAQAKIDSETQQPAAVLARLRGLAQSHGDAAPWRLAVARWLEDSKDPAATNAWVALGDAFPGDLAVQRAVLDAAPSARADRAFVGRTIDRLKALTGEDALQWKLERAKWLLAGGADGKPTHPQTVEAVNILIELVRAAPDRVDSRIWYARALEQAGNRDSAIEHLQAAAARDPRDPRPAFELVRMLRAADRPDDVRTYVNQLADDAVLAPTQKPAVAALLLDLGDVARAAKVLDPAAPGADAKSAAADRADLDPASKLLLAELFRREGRDADAAGLYDQLLARPAPTAETLVSAADFYAAGKQANLAKKTLARLNEPAITPAQRAAALALYAERHGTVDEARAGYRQVTLLAPDNPLGWASYIQFEQRQGDYAAAAKVAADAAARLPNDDGLKTIKQEVDALEQSQKNPEDLGALIAVFKKDPAKAPQAAVLEQLQQVRKSGGGDAELAARLGPIAEKFPRFYPLQQQLVSLDLKLGRADDAAAVAARTADALPLNADAAGLNIAASRAARRWPSVRLAADTLKARFADKNPALARRADVAAAEAELELDRPADALSRLKPYLSSAESGDVPDDVAALAARAFAASGDEAAARSLAEAKLTDQPGPAAAAWRGVWLTIAARDLADADAAKRWLGRVASLTPKAAPAERQRLAAAWASFGEKFGDAAALRRALDEFSLLDPTDPAIIFRVAQLELRLGNLDAAEVNLRKVLAAKPVWAYAARNDLATVLTRKGQPQDLAEAKTLAEQAVKENPGIATFYDTLARAEAAAGDGRAAENHFNQALSLDPQSLDALVGLATLYQARGDGDRAGSLLGQIDAILRTSPPPEPAIKQQLQSLRDRLSKAG